MELYDSEEQQEEAIKRFLKENGVVIALGVVLGLGGIYGFNSYKASQIEQMASDSISYSAVVESNDITAQTEKFVTEHGSTQYSQLAQMLSVKSLVDANKLDEATVLLNSVIGSDVNSTVKTIATIRLARIENSQQKYTQALATLVKVSDSAFDTQKHELIGDIELSQGNVDKARMSYLAAEKASGEQMSNDLRMKLNDLTPAA